jgi:hypothetical protein
MKSEKPENKVELQLAVTEFEMHQVWLELLRFGWQSADGPIRDRAHEVGQIADALMQEWLLRCHHRTAAEIMNETLTKEELEQMHWCYQADDDGYLWNWKSKVLAYALHGWGVMGQQTKKD